MAQPRKPKGSPNGTGGQFDHMSHTDMGLPALDVSTQPVGGQFMDKTAEIAGELFDRKQDWDDLPIGGCYRINDFGDYVTEDDWRDVWDEHPLEEDLFELRERTTATSNRFIMYATGGGTLSPTAALDERPIAVLCTRHAYHQLNAVWGNTITTRTYTAIDYDTLATGLVTVTTLFGATITYPRERILGIV